MLSLTLSDTTIEKLKKLFGAQKINFLGFTLNLETQELIDNFGQADRYYTDWNIGLLTTLLTHYAEGTQKPLTGKLVKYKTFPGGCAYESALNKRALEPIADYFGKNPADLCKAAELLGGKRLGYGDASVQIEPFKGIPLVFTVWAAEDYLASATVLFDESANSYLPVEDLAVTAEVTSARLAEARKVQNEKQQ
jgi:hypothetical protein